VYIIIFRDESVQIYDSCTWKPIFSLLEATLVRFQSFDLVLMHILMPVMRGDEALREIRSMERGTSRHQTVIALTAYSLRHDRERFLNEGFDGYVSKPVGVNVLLAEIKRVLDRTCQSFCVNEVSLKI